MGGHTQTPWVVDESAYDRFEITTQKFLDDSLCEIATLDTFALEEPFLSAQRANAAFIVRAVNCHEELVAALREIAGQPLDAELGDDGPWGSSRDFVEGYDQCIRKARAALAKAEAP